MIETKVQNNTEPWKQEIPEHSETAGTLRPEETLPLIGSFTQSSLEWAEQENKDGKLSDYDLGTETRVHDAALNELASLRVDQGDTVRDTIYDRQIELEKALEGDVSSDPNRSGELMDLYTQLAGVMLLQKMHNSLEDVVDTLAQTHGNGEKSVTANRAAAINELIATHNEQAARSPEATNDSPEVREAQARVAAEEERRAAQPQPVEATVNDARQKVTEALGGIGEKERRALIGQVAAAAEGATRIHTDIPLGTKLKSNGGDYVPIGGFNSFGDGLKAESGFHREMLADASVAEAVVFAPDTVTSYRTETEVVQSGKGFRKKTQEVKREVADREVPVMVFNPATGKEEPGVKVAYQFNGNRVDGRPYDGPMYRTESNRPGNKLTVEATIPESLAFKFQEAVMKDPALAREFAQALLVNNGISNEKWNSAVRPPYDQLPSDWQLSVTNSQKDGAGHKVVNRQAVKV